MVNDACTVHLIRRHRSAVPALLFLTTTPRRSRAMMPVRRQALAYSASSPRSQPASRRANAKKDIVTVIVALTYPGGAIVASDSRRMEADAHGALFTGSDRFAKTFRRDWDHARAANAVERFVIGGIAGQMFHGHLRLTAAIEQECSNPGQPATLAALEQHMLNMMNQWVVVANGGDVVLVASPTLDTTGQPEIRHLHSARGTPAAVRVALNPGHYCVVGSGSAIGLPVVRAHQWTNAQEAEAVARAAVLLAIAAGGDCGGEVSVQVWG